MSHYYLDTSALVKYYVSETGSGWVRALIRATPQPLLVALETKRSLVSHGRAPLVFLSADDRLNHAVSAEGLAVDNPNLYP